MRISQQDEQIFYDKIYRLLKILSNKQANNSQSQFEYATEVHLISDFILDKMEQMKQLINLED